MQKMYYVHHSSFNIHHCQKVKYYKHFFGNYDKHTKSLSILEHGAYRLLIDFYDKKECPLPANLEEIADELCARTTAERAAIHKVLKKFFTLKEDGYHNERCDEDIRDYYELVGKNRENGGKGGRPRKRTVMENKPDGFFEITQPKPSGIEVGFEKKPSPLPTLHTPSTMHQGEGESLAHDSIVHDSIVHDALPAASPPAAKPRKVFIPPTPEEAEAAFIRKFEAEFPVIRDPAAMKKMAASWAEDFLNHYGKVGWKVGSNKMENWRMAIAGWFKRNIEEGKHLHATPGHARTTRNNSEGRSEVTDDDFAKAVSVGNRA